MIRIFISSVLRQITSFPATLGLLTIFCLPIATARVTETKLIDGDGAAYDGFGKSVLRCGDYALVGAWCLAGGSLPWWMKRRMQGSKR